jgi:hypothetical protein
MNKQNTNHAHLELTIFLSLVALVVIVMLLVGNVVFPT